MELVNKHVRRLMKTLEIDWKDLFIPNEEMPSLANLQAGQKWEAPFPITALLTALGDIDVEKRKPMILAVFGLANGTAGANIPPDLHEMLYSRLPYDEDVDANELNIRAALVIAISGCQLAEEACRRGEDNDALHWFGYASHWQGIHYEAIHEDKKRHENARLKGLKRWLDDPKQVAKAAVHECWKLWQEDPRRYRGPTAFANDMLEKFDDLESKDVVMRWCRHWKRQNDFAS